MVNRIGNRFSKRRRHKMLGSGRSGIVFEALKKAPRTYESAWQSAGGVSQGGEIVFPSVVDTKCLVLGVLELYSKL